MPLRMATRLPLEDPGPPARNETGFGSIATPLGATSQAFYQTVTASENPREWCAALWAAATAFQYSLARASYD